MENPVTGSTMIFLKNLVQELIISNSKDCFSLVSTNEEFFSYIFELKLHDLV